MTKNVLFYARYSTDRQDEQSIETQVALGREFARERGWTITETIEDRAISGTKLKSRPGIQNVLRRIKRGDIHVLLCVSVDRISRDMEHSSGILKQLRHHGVELWTVQNSSAVNDMELGLRSIISHDMIEQTRYRTREGMKTSVKKGRAAGGIAYGYRAKLVYDVKGDRIPGEREIDEEQAEIVRWLFEQYVLGRSPKELAVELNGRLPPVPGPRGLKWRDTAIRGHRDRGAGILNNETYIGRLVFNRRNFRKNPETENREARMNDKSEWVVGEVPELRIVSDELWAKVKKRQMEVEASFSHTTTNRLNRTHRPSYLLSGLLECSHCSGPYAIMAKDRYGCTNRQKKLPIEHLGGVVCPNSKTISRHELERRVLHAIPARLLSVDSTASIQDEINKQLLAAGANRERNEGKLRASLRDISHRQEVVAEQITQRIMNGQPQIEAFDKMLDELQKQRDEIEANLAMTTRKTKGPAKTFIINPAMYNAVIGALTAVVRTGASQDETVQRHFSFLRQLVQKVVISPSSDGKSTELTIYGQLAAIRASMQAFQEYSAGLTERHRNEFARRIRAGEFKNQSEKLAYLERFRAVFAEAEAEWKLLQVSVVAGAGFEPAAFRL
ncbi:recombinase family protein [Agrobacterium larrymoorei]|uniref:recombinase family protein n=1 Tax=Agrobacterium larrymoorei TaxID=160699 RepID=UPI00191F9BF5|nr:recombinase family protein [Agrobacterium larrymoorei]